MVKRMWTDRGCVWLHTKRNVNIWRNGQSRVVVEKVSGHPKYALDTHLCGRSNVLAQLKGCGVSQNE